MKKLEIYFDTKKCIYLLILIGIATILISNFFYTYDLTNQDSKKYILYAENLSNFYLLPQQVVIRIFPILIVKLFSNIFFLSIQEAFLLVNYTFFILLLVSCFFFFKECGVKNYLSLSLTGVLIYGNVAILYNLFNFYQIVDLFLYFFIFLQLIFVSKNKPILLFFISICSVLTKEFLIFFSVASFIIQYKTFKNKHSLLFLSFLIFFFVMILFLSGNSQLNINKKNFLTIINIIYQEQDLYFSSIIKCLITDKNILLLIPYIFLLLNKEFINFIKKYSFYFLYIAVPICFSTAMYHQMGGNFFRIFNQGFIVFIIFSLVYLAKSNKNIYANFLLFLLPLSFTYDFFYVFVNIRQHGFYEYFINLRYNLFSSYYIFLIMFVIIIFMNSKYVKKIIHL